ncbi:MAG: hypothetical protein HEEMFOPI_00740 [Holosporales bacterium]
MTFLLNNFKGVFDTLLEKDVIGLAKQLALSIKDPLVIVLKGDLGAGKTTFSRAFIQTFLNDDGHIVPSPTFTIVQEYQKNARSLYHFDLYRLSSADDLVELNFEESIQSGICLIEWPDIALPFLKNVPTLTVTLLKKSDTVRKITIC